MHKIKGSKKIKSSVICILGMHRSGTSMVTRILNLCGLSLGEPEEMFASTHGNERGHWENIRFMKINMEIIKTFSNSKDADEWNTQPVFPKGWQNSKKISNLRKKAIGLVKEFDSRYLSWGWKGPRNCITLPFWQEILGDRLKYVIVVRQPIDVANSLLKRNNYPLTEGLLLWNRYLSDAITYTQGLPRYFISSEKIFSDQEKEVKSVLSFIGNKNLVFNQNVNKQIKSFVSKDIWHFQKNKDLLNSNQEEIVRTISQLYSQAINELDGLYKKLLNDKDELINKQNTQLIKLENSKYYRIYQFLLVVKYKLKRLWRATDLSLFIVYFVYSDTFGNPLLYI